MSFDSFRCESPSSTRTGADEGAGHSRYSYFYNHLHFQEVRATLRYGVEAHKGLILFTGKAGRGKTTLLYAVIRELEDDVTFVVQSDAGASFDDLLYLLARRRRVEIHAFDRLSLLERCKRALRSDIDRGRTVCLIIDNAERLSDDTLDGLLENFAGYQASADHGRPLLQMLLAGRPELRHRLLQPNRRLPAPDLICHVESLDREETAAYIRRRLQSGDRSWSALHKEAIDRIASCAGGNLRVINALCSGALALAARSATPTITVEVVDAAARAIGLAGPRVEHVSALHPGF